MVFLSHSREDGQGLAEYALILSLIVIFAVAVVFFLGGQIIGMLTQIGQLI